MGQTACCKRRPRGLSLGLARSRLPTGDPAVAHALSSSPAAAAVQLLPPQRDVEAVLRGCVALLAPSLWLEAWGMVVTEALLRGLPALVSDLGASHDGVRERGSAHAMRGSLWTSSAGLKTQRGIRAGRWGRQAARRACGSWARGSFADLMTPRRRWPSRGGPGRVPRRARGGGAGAAAAGHGRARVGGAPHPAAARGRGGGLGGGGAAAARGRCARGCWVRAGGRGVPGGRCGKLRGGRRCGRRRVGGGGRGGARGGAAARGRRRAGARALPDVAVGAGVRGGGARRQGPFRFVGLHAGGGGRRAGVLHLHGRHSTRRLAEPRCKHKRARCEQQVVPWFIARSVRSTHAGT
jgi:hypothetical protein